MHKRSFRNFLTCNDGSSLVLTGAAFLVLIMVLGVVVDLGRLYAVEGKVQNASDAALLGAVSTVDTVPLVTEYQRLFEANFPTNYMGSNIITTAVMPLSEEVFEARINIQVPYTVMHLFGMTYAQFNVLSQVTRRLAHKLELSMVLDTTGSMNAMTPAGVTKLEALKVSANTLIDILFGSESMLPNLHISVVPYSTNVNIGNTSEHQAWVQAPYVASFSGTGFSDANGRVSNRHSDCPLPGNGFNDITDDLPQTEELRFRVPRAGFDSMACGLDSLAGNTPVVALLNTKAPLQTYINSLVAGGNTRINVGLMWGWFTISEKWQGMWGVPGLPETPGSRLTKALILMTDGQNTVFGAADNARVEALCTELKNRGILLYVVGFGFGGTINIPILQACATQPNPPYFFVAPTPAELQTAFQAIADSLLANSIRLTQ